jgi:MFS family permease
VVRDGRVAREGVVAGLIGAATVALLILVFDVAGGVPLQTPAILGSFIFHGVRDPHAVTISAGAVAGYTVVHGVAFLVVGVIAAFLVAGAEREPAMVLALLIFFAAFEVFFLALIAFLALPILGVLAWWEILAGNFVAAVSMLYYFYRRHRGLVQGLMGRWVDVVREGVAAGFLGGAVVAVWFLVYDSVKLRPLRTPSLLGSALLQGLRDPNRLAPQLDVVVGYTVFHFTVFALFGVMVAALLLAAEREPRVLLVLFVLFLCFQLFFFGFLQALDVHLEGALPWWNIAIGNLLASVAMVTYFFLGHRSLGAQLLERWTED